MKPSEILKTKLPEIKALMTRSDISEKFENLRVFGSVAEDTDMVKDLGTHPSFTKKITYRTYFKTRIFTYTILSL